MAVVVGEAAVRLRPETSRFASEAEGEIDRSLPGVAKKAAGMFAAAMVTAGIGAFVGHAIEQATDLGENVSKVGVVFGDQAARIEEFASTASTALGQSQNQALEAAGTFGTLFTGMGLGQAQAADMSTQFVTLASDMASFGNATPQEALDALRAGLIGETEPLRRFGVMLDAASIEAEALRLGLVAEGEELSAAAKAQAAYSLVLAQTAVQQGDFQRTSEGLANQQRILRAQFTDVATDVGGLFVPMLANLANMVTGSVMPAILGFTERLPAIGDALGGVGDMFRLGFSDGAQAVFDATRDMEGLGIGISLVAGYMGDLAAIMRESFIGGAGDSPLLDENSWQGLAAVIGDVAYTIMGALGPAFASIMGAAGPALAQVSEAFSAAFGGGGGGGGILAGIGNVLQTVGPLIADYIARWAPIIATVVTIIGDVLAQLAPVIGGLVASLGPVLASLLPIVSQVAGVFATTLLTVIQALAPAIPPLVAAIGSVATILAGAFLSVLQQLAPVIPTLVTAIGQIAVALAGALGGALAAIAPVLPQIATVLGQVASMLAGALAGALQALLPILPPIVQAFGQIAVVLVGALMGALSAILPVIPQLVSVFVLLIQSAVVPLLPILPLLANLLVTIIAAIAPLIPTVIQVVALLIQLAVAALLPLMPAITVVANLITMLIGVIVPIIQVLVAVVGGFVGMAATVVSVVVGFVSTVVGIWSGLIGAVSGIFNSIFSVVRGIFMSIAGWVSGAVSGIASSISGAFSGVMGAVSRIFGGIGDAVSSAFSAVGGIIRGAVNGAIGAINTGIGFINRNLIGNVNKLPGIDIGNIPTIPRLHSGGFFDSGDASGEGLALLRDRELVATPEQQALANDLLGQLLAGRLADAGSTTNVDGGSTTITIEEHIHAAPGEDAGVIAARATQSVVWNLNGGLTRRLGAEALT